MTDFELTEDLKRQLSALPDEPGVYIFRNLEGEVVYIGKALSLKNRVKSYWNQTAWRERPKLHVMMPKVAKLDTILTHSEKEALLLEATLIRQHMPRYNIALKDDRRYPWLAITYDVSYPRLIMVRDPVRYRKEHPKNKVFGPYVETGQMWETVRVLRKVFPMRQRKKPLFKDRPCMNYYIGLCLAPCQNMVAEELYDSMVKQVEMFLSGRQSEVVQQLTTEMEKSADELDFEQAAKIRDRLKALETVIEKQQVFFENEKVMCDVVAEAHTEKLLAACIMRVREGKLVSSETMCLTLTEKTGWDEAFQSFVDQYYAQCEDVYVPTEVIVQHPLEDLPAIEELLTSKLQRSVKVFVPSRGAKVNLIEMAKKNAQQSLEYEFVHREEEMDAKSEALLSRLKEELGISRLPKRIECFDISNIQGSDIVASMVVFERGQAKTKDYRTFKIKTVTGGEPNDFASMKEVVGRRYSRLLQEGKPLPDLVIIDGGKGQLGAALEALAELEQAGLPKEPFDIIGLAKRHEEVFFPYRSQPVLLSRRSEALYLLQRVRNEAHRFAVTFHRKVRAKRSLKSEMDMLKGVGSARRKLLLDYFGTFANLKEATSDALLAVPGLPRNVAVNIFSQLHPAPGEAESADSLAQQADEEVLESPD
ncbi:MAG: excinuclease ABC subunit UvrC [Candidatus Obscuribacterales bacterium]|nr:excinuclease ABC subunit UvrC [Candidatus Obscuribacterales bacterium]